MDLVDFWNIKIKANEVNDPLGIWLVGGWLFYLGDSGWNGGWWCLAFRRVAAILPLPSLLQPPDPLFKGALVAALLRSCVLLVGLSVNVTESSPTLIGDLGDLKTITPVWQD